MRRTRLGVTTMLLATVALLLVATTACGSSSKPRSGRSGKKPPRASSRHFDPPDFDDDSGSGGDQDASDSSSGSGSAPTGRASSTGLGGACQTSELVLEVIYANRPGQIAETVVVRNTSTRTCVVSGHPELAYVGVSDTPIGDDADPVGGEGTAVVLAPGDRASVTLTSADPAGLAGCGAGKNVVPKGLRVTPPGATDPLLLRWPTEAVVCTDPAVHQHTVTPFVAG